MCTDYHCTMPQSVSRHARESPPGKETNFRSVIDIFANDPEISN